MRDRDLRVLALCALGLLVGCKRGGVDGDAGLGDASFDALFEFCDDADDDLICDEHEGNGDPDEDGTPNFEDTDSDDDGIPDLTEAGDEDPRTVPSDSNGDRIPDYLDPNFPVDRRTDAGLVD